MEDQDVKTELNQSGSINIGANNSVEVGGDMVGGNKIETTFGDVGAGAQVAVGTGNTLSMTIHYSPPSDAERAEVSLLIADLKAQLAALDLPEAKKLAGQEFVGEIETELTKTEGRPDGGLIKAAGNWLLKNAPALASAMAGLFLNPIIGKVVGAAGDLVADWVKEKFGAGS